jgi:hypothetical protein
MLATYATCGLPVASTAATDLILAGDVAPPGLALECRQYGPVTGDPNGARLLQEPGLRRYRSATRPRGEIAEGDR